MIPAIMRKEMARLMPQLPTLDARRGRSDKESAAIIGFTSAIAAFGAFFIPKAYGTSIALTGGAEAALWGFLVFYVSCIAITWVSTPAAAACCTTSSAAAAQSDPPPHAGRIRRHDR